MDSAVKTQTEGRNGQSLTQSFDAVDLWPECGKGILIIEDGPDIVNLLAFRFPKVDRLSVSSVADGRSRLEQVREQLPDLVILDLALPEVPKRTDPSLFDTGITGLPGQRKDFAGNPKIFLAISTDIVEIESEVNFRKRILGTYQRASRERKLVILSLSLTFLLCLPAFTVRALTSSTTNQTPIFISEYRVEGAHKLSRIEVEEAVYSYLGPGRTADDVEQARAALEKAYRDKGYQTVSVQVPAQTGAGGIVVLHVVEAPVGRLRVKSSRFYSPRSIKRQAPSLAEGTVPNFNAVSRDIVGLNQLPDRRVTPTLRAGGEPGTVDIDLNVTDTLPLHGSLELNNRYSPETTELRLNGSLNYQNLWDLGHSIGFSFQLAPERLDDAKVYSAYYLLRVPEINWLTLIAQGTKQDSDVSTLGGAGVAGRGEVAGARAIFSLPLGKDFYHSLTLGFDYKHYTQNLTIAGNEVLTPVTYYPLSLDYNATWTAKGSTTVFDGGVNFNIRGLGSDQAEFDFNRFKASGNFFYFRADLSHTHELPQGWQLFGKVQGQVADGPLLSSEQFNAGGLATVRGYLESEVLGDDAIFGSIELRTPSLFPKSRGSNEWRFYLFGEGGWLNLQDVLPEQESQFTLASFGGGTRIRFQDHFNGSLDVGVPLISQTDTKMWDLLLTFRVWADF